MVFQGSYQILNRVNVIYNHDFLVLVPLLQVGFPDDVSNSLSALNMKQDIHKKSESEK